MRCRGSAQCSGLTLSTLSVYSTMDPSLYCALWAWAAGEPAAEGLCDCPVPCPESPLPPRID